MKKNVNAFGKYLLIFLIGMATYGFVQAAILSAKGRVGVIGGEVLILPLIVGLIWLGWQLATMYHDVKRRGRW